MRNFRRLQSILAAPLASVFLFCALPVAAVNAKMIGTDEILIEESIAADREKVVNFVSRDDVRLQMENLGVDPDEARLRVQALSERDIQRMAGRLEHMPAGEGAAGTVLGVALTVFVILLITDILCLTDVFNFTRTCS